MRRLLGVLRASDEEVALGPQPSLSQVETLASKVREAGLPVEVSIAGLARELPAGVDLSAYRIVQEALTNALKHAGPARANVLIRYGEGHIEVEVTDDGAGATNGDGRGRHGLLGMQERVALYGGELETGPRDGGGFAVRARLPL
jgi:signal transduction histidine kinase